MNVYANEGENILQLRGAGISDNAGLTVDNVKLVKEGTTQNLVVNGGFERPKIEKDFGGFQGIEGWSSTYMEIGVGSYFNLRWPSQVCELDGVGNSIITQKFLIKDLLYTLSLNFAARENFPLETSQGEVWWNYEKILNLQPNDYELKAVSVKVYGQPG